MTDAASQVPPISPAAAVPPPLPRHADNGRLVDPTISHDQRTYCLLMHASIILLHVIGPLSFLVPLAMWMVKKGDSPFIDDHGKETVNFHLSIMLYALAGFALVWVVCIGVVVLAGAYVLAITGGVMACLAASRAEYFRYPMCIRFIR